jgi:hypothetical protein
MHAPPGLLQSEHVSSSRLSLTVNGLITSRPSGSRNSTSGIHSPQTICAQRKSLVRLSAPPLLGQNTHSCDARIGTGSVDHVRDTDHPSSSSPATCATGCERVLGERNSIGARLAPAVAWYRCVVRKHTHRSTTPPRGCCSCQRQNTTGGRLHCTSHRI